MQAEKVRLFYLKSRRTDKRNRQNVVMSGQPLKNLFKQFSESSCIVEKMKIDSENQVSMFLYFPTYDEYVINNLNKAFKSQYPSLELVVYYNFGENCFCEKAVPFVIDRIRDTGMPINGFFHQAKYHIYDGKVFISLGSKTINALEKLNFSEKFCQFVQKYFHVRTELNLTEPEDVKTVPVSDELLEMTGYKEKKPSKAIKKYMLSDTDIKSCLFELEDDSYEIVLGKKPPLSNLQSIKNAVSKSGKVVISGDVIESEHKELRNKAVVRTVLITDFDDSV
ncbi:MAG: hypothetical protein Q4D71_06120 [Oscillospiraceae bacterium]|nr:hypothetical protein [Oscillospiraceae bacterium]